MSAVLPFCFSLARKSLGRLLRRPTCQPWGSNVNMPMSWCVRVCARTHASKRAGLQARERTSAQAHKRASAGARKRARARARRLASPQARRHAARAHGCKRAGAQSPSLAHTLARTCACRHACSHARMHVHAHASVEAHNKQAGATKLARSPRALRGGRPSLRARREHRQRCSSPSYRTHAAGLSR